MMKTLFLLITISIIACSTATDVPDCVFYRHVKPVDRLNFLVCTIGIILPQHIPPVRRIGTETIYGLLIGDSDQVADASTLEKFPGVAYYGLINHRIEHVTKESLAFLTRMDGFDLTKGYLMKIDFDAFQDFKNLKDLDLSKNKLEYLHPQLFSSLKVLEKINLSGNQLVAVEQDMFAQNFRLSKINLSENKISYIHTKAFEANLALRELYLHGNTCINIDYTPPKVQTLKYVFGQQCRVSGEILNMLSDKRNEAESIDYEISEEE